MADVALQLNPVEKGPTQSKGETRHITSDIGMLIQQPASTKSPEIHWRKEFLRGILERREHCSCIDPGLQQDLNAVSSD